MSSSQHAGPRTRDDLGEPQQRKRREQHVVKLVWQYIVKFPYPNCEYLLPYTVTAEY
jgi:hypothetical protein